MRKNAILSISVDLIVEMSKATRPFTLEITKNRLPQDAHIVQIDYDADFKQINAVLESEEFAAISDGEKPPVLIPPTFKQTEASP